MGFLNVLTVKMVRVVVVRQRSQGEDVAAGVEALGESKVPRLLVWDNAPHQTGVARTVA